MRQNQILGQYGEELAAQYLSDRGYVIHQRNWRCAAGEIDLIAKHRNCWIFVEVKTRSGTGFGHPFEAITSQKMARMRKLAAQWCNQNKISGAAIRLDAIAVLVRHGNVAIEHLKQVF